MIANWGDYSADADGIDWRSFLVILALVVGVTAWGILAAGGPS